MKYFIVAFFFFSMLPLNSAAIDLHQHLNKTRLLVDEGNYREALNRYEWYSKYSIKHQQSMDGVRLSYAVTDWKNLADVYPPAMKSLRDIRNKSLNLIQQGNSNGGYYNCDLFGDVAALNNVLSEPEQTVSLFELLDKEQPNFARRCWVFAERSVLQAKQYDLAAKYMGDPMQQFLEVKGLIDHQKNNLVEESLKLIALSLSVGDNDTAYEIRTAALAIVDDFRLHSAISDT